MKPLSTPSDGAPHTPQSLADVLEKDYKDSLTFGAQLYLSSHEWRMVVNALRSERLAMPEEAMCLHPMLRGEWTPSRCLHLGEATQIQELCKLLNALQPSNERNST